MSAASASVRARHQDLAAHVAAFLDRGELVLVMHAGRAGLDHRLHQLERIEHAAETGLGIGHDRREPVDVSSSGLSRGGFHGLDLVGAHERVVDAPHDRRHRGDRVERLVGIHRERVVGVRRDLPAREVDRRHAGAHLLHRLVAGDRAERIDEGTLVAQLPELFRAESCERVLDSQAAAQLEHVGRVVAALDALPARILGPVLLQLRAFLLSTAHHFSL